MTKIVRHDLLLPIDTGGLMGDPVCVFFHISRSALGGLTPIYLLARYIMVTDIDSTAIDIALRQVASNVHLFGFF